MLCYFYLLNERYRYLYMSNKFLALHLAFFGLSVPPPAPFCFRRLFPSSPALDHISRLASLSVIVLFSFGRLSSERVNIESETCNKNGLFRHEELSFMMETYIQERRKRHIYRRGGVARDYAFCCAAQGAIQLVARAPRGQKQFQR